MLLIALAIFLAGCLLIAQARPHTAARLERRAATAVAQFVLTDRHHNFRVLNAMACASRSLETLLGRN